MACLPTASFFVQGHCPQHGSTVKGFASVASSKEGMRRVGKSSYLRTALLVHGDWEVKLAENEERKDMAELGHSTRVHYKKCRNEGLLPNTEVSCRLAHCDGSPSNGSASMRFTEGIVLAKCGRAHSAPQPSCANDRRVLATAALSLDCAWFAVLCVL